MLCCLPPKLLQSTDLLTADSLKHMRTHSQQVITTAGFFNSEESNQYWKKWYQSEKELFPLLFATLSLSWFYNINSGFRPGPLIWNVCFLFLHVYAQDYFILLLLLFVIFKEILDPDNIMLFCCGPGAGTLQAAVPESLTSCWGLHGRCVHGQSADPKPPEERWRSAHSLLLLSPPALLLLSLAPPAVKQKNPHVAVTSHWKTPTCDFLS